MSSGSTESWPVSVAWEVDQQEARVSSRKRTVDAYFDGFRASDHEAILALLSDDVVWVIHGHGRTEGKEAFDREIENDAFEGSPKLTVERLIEEGDTVVAPHLGEGRLKSGDVFRFAGVTVLGFDGELISRVESYIVPLPG
jgi:ketosteroid isomerase-like protein